MNETAAERFERHERLLAATLAFLRAGPHEPMSTRAQVLEDPCPVCHAEPGAECDGRPPRPALAGLALRGMSGVHIRRYLNRTGDPR